MNGFEVDPGALEEIASKFRSAGEDVDALAKSMPGTPDAGDGTPAVTGILAHLVDNASSLVLGMAGAADDIVETNKTYEEQDATAGDELNKSSGGGSNGHRHEDRRQARKRPERQQLVTRLDGQGNIGCGHRDL